MKATVNTAGVKTERTVSADAYRQACKYIPGGVNSPVRALKSVGETPLFIQKAKGTTLTDIDGNRYDDYCLSWGVFLLGHGHPAVNKAARWSISRGTSYGIPTLVETALAKTVTANYPSIEQVRFVNSGTEAVMSAVRLARGYTGRDIIVKFDGCYHGHADHLLVSAGSGVVALAGSSSAGVPTDVVKNTISLPFNDPEALSNFFASNGDKVAAVIMEPVPANMGVVIPVPGYLQFLRDITRRYGALLIFDEVITGGRLSSGGAQKKYGVIPDITTLGKIVGGGFPAAAFGGPRAIMSLLAPEGPVYQAGTLSGNPVAMAAGLATLDTLHVPGAYAELERKSENFINELKGSLEGLGVTVNSAGPMFTIFFSDGPVMNFADALECDTERFARYFRYMLSRGIYVSPSQFEACFISTAHSQRQLDRFIKTATEALRKN